MTRIDTTTRPAAKGEITRAERTASGPVTAHGAEVPVLGFGTWELTGDEATRMVELALEVGYRHLDTAQAYQNEDRVGRGLRSSGVPRSEVWVTTKVWPDNYAPATFRSSVRESLDRLGLDSVDLLLLHWPKFDGTSLEATVALLNEARDEGWTKHIGVSNFPTDLLDRAWEASDAPLVVNQVEYHPFLAQEAVLAAVRRRRMALTAYSPIAQGQVEESGTLRRIADEHGKTPEQVSLRWLVQQEGVTAIPRTSDPDHCRENFEIFDFRLSDEEMERIADLAHPEGRIIDPDDLAPDWD